MSPAGASPEARKPLPPGWRWVRLGEVCGVVGGSTPDSGNPAYWEGNITWVTPTDLGRIVTIFVSGSERRISLSGLKSCSTELVPVGSVVMSSRAPIGHLAIAAVELCTNQGCKSFVPGSSVDSVFLYWALKLSVPDLKALGSGATFAEVSKSQLARFSFPLPPLPEQKRIATKLNEQMKAATALRQSLEAQLAENDALPAALLRRAFSGAL